MSTLNTPENFDFPFTPYNIQHEFMSHLYEAIEKRCLGIFESPTGTGKSLSIICSAIKWLKDHNARERDDLNKQIDKLSREKEHLDEEIKDWFSAQSNCVEVSKELFELKSQRNKINDYDKRIEQMVNRTKQQKKSKKCIQKFTTKVNRDESASKSIKEEIEEDDLLLEDEINMIKDNIEDDILDEDEDNKRYENVKIFICSRTHSQLSQFIGEIIKSPFGENVRVVTLGSRKNYCINPIIRKLDNIALINERCLDMQQNQKKSIKKCEEKIIKRAKLSSDGKCEYFNQGRIEDLRDFALNEVLDIEDLVSNGKEIRACPYYASRKAAEDSEVILVPYNTILHRATREASGIKLKDNVVIVDEAHNLSDAIAQMYSAEVNYSQLYYCYKQLFVYKNKYNTRFSHRNLSSINQILFVVSRLKKLFESTEDLKQDKSEIFTVSSFVLKAEIDNYNMYSLVKFCKDSRLAQKLRGFSFKYPVIEKTDKPTKGVKQFLSSIENKKVPPKKVELKHDELVQKPPANPLVSVVSFMEALTYSYEDGRVIINNTVDRIERKLKYLVLNPTEHFKEIINEARSVIVAGGTMKPIEEFRDRLFKTAGAAADRIVEFSCDHIVPPENILPIILTGGPKKEKLRFNYENRLTMGDSVKSILIEACERVPGGIVVFFPSYKYENWFWQQAKNLQFNRPIFREPQTSSGVDAVLEDYAKSIKKTKRALLFSVVGGKLSEGLNFSDDLGRCVIVVGMPYANINSVDLKEKMNYLDQLEQTGAGQRFYESLCMKSVNQCIGRAVRHKDDYATVILLDERYNRQTTKEALPRWIQRSIKTYDFNECFRAIEEFFKNKN